MSGVLSVLAGSTGGPTATLTAATYEISGVGSPASLQFGSTGALWATTTSPVADIQYYWLTSGSASDCKLVYSVTSGAFTSAPASGSTINTPLIFTRGATPGNIQTVVASFQIQKVSDSSVLAGPVTITITCDNI